MSGTIGGAGSKSGVIGLAGGGIKPAVLMYMSAAQTMTHCPSHTKINFDSTVYNFHGTMDTTNKRWIPLVAGYYEAFIFIVGHNVSNTIRCTGQIYKNGNGGTSVGYYSVNGNFQGEQMNYETYGAIEMNGTTDYFEGWCNFTASVPQINDGAAATKLMIHRVN